MDGGPLIIAIVALLFFSSLLTVIVDRWAHRQSLLSPRAAQLLRRLFAANRKEMRGVRQIPEGVSPSARPDAAETVALHLEDAE
jgi:hypothetical protein